MNKFIFLTGKAGILAAAVVLTGLLPRTGLGEPAVSARAAAEASRVTLSGKDMIVEFDRLSGAVFSIKAENDPLGTNFMGNPENTRGADPSGPGWTGNLVFTTWKFDFPRKPPVLIPSFSFRPSGSWRTEWTGNSEDIRTTAYDGRTFTVRYRGKSKNPDGLQSHALTLTYRMAEDGALEWDIEIENTSGDLLEFGELGFPYAVNDDYFGVRTSNPYTNTADDHEVLYQDERQKVEEQKLIHEQRVIAHHFVGGHGSYTLIQRLLGNAPFLLVHPAGDTAFECQYRMDAPSGAGRRRRPEVLAVHSRAVKDRRRWETPWVNGHTSLVLAPGEKKAFRIRFLFIRDYAEIRERLSRSGGLGVRILPSMVVQEGTPVYVELKSRYDPELEFLSDNMSILEERRAGGAVLLTLAFKGRGQKSLRVSYGENKWTNLHFYCTENLERLIKARARFIVERQFYDNPDDPFNRHHMFLPFDDRTGSVYKDSDNVWEVGGNDEYGFSEPVFLAEKNVYYPDKHEVETLEAYVDDCLFKHIQDPETYALRASLYWKKRTPSSPWGHWTEERSKETYRTYNYPHAANVYHALYRIGKLYGLTARRPPLEYLKMAYRTGIQWFNTGPWRHVGVMCGSNVLNILADLQAEGLEEEHARLLDEVRRCARVFVETPYPYSSELFVDQTAHEQVYFFTRFFDFLEKAEKTLQVIQALRGGNQPAWFRYGNDKRGDGACWYTESLNGLPLLHGFEESGDPDLLIKGFAGVASVTANLRLDGMGFGRFNAAPGVFAPDPPRTQDNGIGMYGFFKAAKAYVLRDSSFGLIGCGCGVREENGKIRVLPADGLRKRIRFMREKLDLEALKGEFREVVLGEAGRSIELGMSDSTGLVDAYELILRGLEPGRYKIASGETTRSLDCSGRLALKVPAGETDKIRIEREEVSVSSAARSSAARRCSAPWS